MLFYCWIVLTKWVWHDQKHWNKDKQVFIFFFERVVKWWTDVKYLDKTSNLKKKIHLLYWKFIIVYVRFQCEYGSLRDLFKMQVLNQLFWNGLQISIFNKLKVMLMLWVLDSTLSSKVLDNVINTDLALWRMVTDMLWNSLCVLNWFLKSRISFLLPSAPNPICPIHLILIVVSTLVGKMSPCNIT